VIENRRIHGHFINTSLKQGVNQTRRQSVQILICALVQISPYFYFEIRQFLRHNARSLCSGWSSSFSLSGGWNRIGAS
jgi:hypothetical protein